MRKEELGQKRQIHLIFVSLTLQLSQCVSGAEEISDAT